MSCNSHVAFDWDYAIIGSGFGGSVCGLRLVEKGYRVVMLEKGRRFRSEDFPRSNWNLPRWLWMPAVGCRGIFKMTFLRHVTVLSGVGVGGGSLVYANTLPTPKDEFFALPSWGHLADWKRELDPHYANALRMLGAVPNPVDTYSDQVLRDIAGDLGRPDKIVPTRVAVYFGEPEKTVPDPYLGGEGPDRTGCIQCGACMTGCRHNAKNTLDKNYLWLAEKRGLRIEADTEVTFVRELAGGGYRLDAITHTGWFGRRRRSFAARNVILAGGVLGTVPLLLKLKACPAGLPRLSDRVGSFVRTNSEALMCVTTRADRDLSKGIAITSLLQTDEHSHLEPVRYGKGSGFFRLLVSPHVAGPNAPLRLIRALAAIAGHPVNFLRASFVDDWAKRTMILLYMRTLDGHLRMRLGALGLTTALEEGPRPSAAIPEATELARRVERKIDGYAGSLLSETIMGTPTTAHILGGACMGATPEQGVIDDRHRVFGYEGLYVIDGSAVSANPGVNPSLTIAALAERAMSFVPSASSVKARTDAPANRIAVAPGTPNTSVDGQMPSCSGSRA
jgi:cholesterol oxidase